MEISDVKRRVTEAIDRAKRTAAERRARADEASREYDAFLADLAVPLFRQIANVLRARGYLFSVATPGGSVRLQSDSAAGDYIELLLDSSGDPRVLIHSGRARGRRIVESERPIGSSPIRELKEEDVLEAVLKDLESLAER